MGLSTLVLVLATASPGATISERDRSHQQESFRQLWEDDFVWEFDRLPVKGGVPVHRIPYSGYIYPDNEGGTAYPLRKYDAAFNGGRALAASHERWDTTAFKEKAKGLLGVFGVKHTPDWYGHCNGWTSATIRHAEPQRNVKRNGVTFSPSDIKGLLAELYTYNEHIVLGGENQDPITAGAFHAIITNWIGRREHALGMEADPGKEKWNYPAYGYSATFAKQSDRRVEVNMNVLYAIDSHDEWDESPLIDDVKFFHYMLELDEQGKIVGGRFFHDSSHIDMLWVPVAPKKPGGPGNEAGNPYLDVDNVLALWRDSVPEDVRLNWSRSKWASEEEETSVPSVVSILDDNDETDASELVGQTDPRVDEVAIDIGERRTLSRFITIPEPKQNCSPNSAANTVPVDEFNALLRSDEASRSEPTRAATR